MMFFTGIIPVTLTVCAAGFSSWRPPRLCLCDVWEEVVALDVGAEGGVVGFYRAHPLAALAPVAEGV